MSLLGLMTNVSKYPVKGYKSIRVSTNVTGGSMLTHNRELIVRSAIKRGADYILWLDTDMVFPKDTLAHLLRWDKPFVAAQGVTKQLPAEPVAQDLEGKRVYGKERDRGLKEVSQVGLAVALTKTEYVARVTKPRFEMRYEEEHDAPCGEDVWFCRKWREELGLPIYVDMGLSYQIGHLGGYSYGLKDVGELVEHQKSSKYRRVA